MSYEVIQTVGKHQYIYLAEGYRNENGKPRQKRRSIGKIDPDTGEKIYKPSYIEELRGSGIPIEVSATKKIFSIEDVQKSSVRSYGLFYLYRNIAERLGLLDALENALPGVWMEVFMLTCYMISTNDPLMYCASWIKDNESYPVGSMASQRISELLIDLLPEQRERFYELWYEAHEEDEYLALDITSESSYSELIGDVEWGYNRDGDKLPQINICMLMGESSRLPVHQSIYSGSLRDVSTLHATLSRFEATTGKRAITIVMDKGFFSTRNIASLLGGDGRPPVKFLIAVPFTSSFAKKQIDSERKDIDCAENTLLVGGCSMRAVTKERSFSKDHKVYTHIYYNAKKASGIREDLYAHVALLKEEAVENPEKVIHDEAYRKYLTIRRSEKQETGYTITIRGDVIEQALKTAGWMVLISNDVFDAKKAISIYRDKDVVEKGFQRLKNNIDLGRLRVHSDNAMQGKLFVGFIASVLMSEINRVMSEHNLYKKYTMQALLSVVAKLKVQEINDQSIIYPVTKEQRMIFEAFEVDVPYS